MTDQSDAGSADAGSAGNGDGGSTSPYEPYETRSAIREKVHDGVVVHVSECNTTMTELGKVAPPNSE
eukprot:6195717-Pyramimonas_sp.AAC.1